LIEALHFTCYHRQRPARIERGVVCGRKAAICSSYKSAAPLNYAEEALLPGGLGYRGPVPNHAYLLKLVQYCRTVGLAASRCCEWQLFTAKSHNTESEICTSLTLPLELLSKVVAPPTPTAY